jgi:BirA family biotin operon repressor/biotin-[acetyl-CoA-carboxylase] ligase
VTEILKNRAPLDAQILEHELLLRQCLWQNAIIKDEVTSTNDIARDLVSTNIEEGTFVLANFQTKGRGRQNRNWEAPKNSSIFISIVLKPNSDKNLGWIPLLVGLSLHKALEAETRKDIRIKWPNDLVLVENSQEFKFAGILIERINNQIIVGVGINFDQEKEELPISNASSLKQILQSPISKESVIAAFLTELSARWLEENNANSWPTPSLVRDYKTNCITLDKKITAQLPGGELINGQAVDVSQIGELVVKTDDGTRSLSSADIHLIS